MPQKISELQGIRLEMELLLFPTSLVLRVTLLMADWEFLDTLEPSKNFKTVN
jgi:hypothetical protein